MATGVIAKALSGFYYIHDAGKTVSCRAKGRFRHDGMSPLVGDRVEYSLVSETEGVLERILPRKNSFIRPAVANIDAMVFVACGAKPVTDPFLIDRVAVIADNVGCEMIVCINKCDLNPANELYQIYRSCGFQTVRTSALTGEGIEDLRAAIRGKICAFTSNSGAGKSSLLNALKPDLCLETGEISDKLGRGKHTTRHVEFFPLDDSTLAADTPGFASFEVEMVDNIEPEQLQNRFMEFTPYLDGCRFTDCRHLNEPDCAVLQAVAEGKIPGSRHESYAKLYGIIKDHKPWD